MQQNNFSISNLNNSSSINNLPSINQNTFFQGSRGDDDIANLAKLYSNPTTDLQHLVEGEYCSVVTGDQERLDAAHHKIAEHHTKETVFDVSGSIENSATVQNAIEKYETLEKKLQDQEIDTKSREYERREPELNKLKQAMSKVDQNFQGSYREPWYEYEAPSEEGGIGGSVQKEDPRMHRILKDSDENNLTKPNGNVYTYGSAFNVVKEIEALKNPPKDYLKSREYKNAEHNLKEAKVDSIIKTISEDPVFLKSMVIKSGGNLEGVKFHYSDSANALRVVPYVKDIDGKNQPLAVLRYNCDDASQTLIKLRFSEAMYEEGNVALTYDLPNGKSESFLFSDSMQEFSSMGVKKLSNSTNNEIRKYNNDYIKDPKGFGEKLKAENPDNKELQNMRFAENSNSRISHLMSYGSGPINEKSEGRSDKFNTVGVSAIAGSVGLVGGFVAGYYLKQNPKPSLSVRREAIRGELRDLGEDLTKIKKYMKSQTVPQSQEMKDLKVREKNKPESKAFIDEPSEIIQSSISVSNRYKDIEVTDLENEPSQNSVNQAHTQKHTGINLKYIEGLVGKANETEVTKLEKQFNRIDNDYSSSEDAYKEIAKILNGIAKRQERSFQIV